MPSMCRQKRCDELVKGCRVYDQIIMDLKKLKPTKSLFQAPKNDAHQRLRAPVVPTAPKVAGVTPEGKGGELWCRYYHDALMRGHPEPEKMADTALRARERTLALAAARPAVKQMLEVPKSVETAVVNKGKTVIPDGERCKATTLEGRRCGFKATCGAFCKKHAVEKI